MKIFAIAAFLVAFLAHSVLASARIKEYRLGEAKWNQLNNSNDPHVIMRKSNKAIVCDPHNIAGIVNMHPNKFTKWAGLRVLGEGSLASAYWIGLLVKLNGKWTVAYTPGKVDCNFGCTHGFHNQRLAVCEVPQGLHSITFTVREESLSVTISIE